MVSPLSSLLSTLALTTNSPQQRKRKLASSEGMDEGMDEESTAKRSRRTLFSQIRNSIGWLFGLDTVTQSKSICSREIREGIQSEFGDDTGTGRQAMAGIVMNSLREKVFTDLNLKGFFVGPGDLYGADYSIYVCISTMCISVATTHCNIFIAYPLLIGWRPV